MSEFPLPMRLKANPHYYDYLHAIDLDEDGSVEMIDGAGQLINTLIKGKFRMTETDAGMRLEFTNLAEYDPYNDEKLDDLPDQQVMVTRETGQFTFHQEVVWKIDKPEHHPCLLYETRYVFDHNPVSDQTRDNLYHALENKDFGDSLRVYYAVKDEIELTLSELKKRNLPRP